jgi:hypothetical protein
MLAEIVQLLIVKRNQAQLESNYVFQNFGKKSDQDLKSIATSVMLGMKKLGMLDMNEMLNIKKNQTHKNVICDFLTKKLSYEKGENDLVFMHHSITVNYPEDVSKVYNSTLALYGDDNYTATGFFFHLLILFKLLLLGSQLLSLQDCCWKNNLKELLEQLLHMNTKKFIPKY